MAQLESAIRDPNATVVYVSSGRRLSAQQLEAHHRRLSLQEFRTAAQREIDEFEDKLTETLDCWRTVPPMPRPEQYQASLHRQECLFSEPVPIREAVPKPDLEVIRRGTLLENQRVIGRAEPFDTLNAAMGGMAALTAGGIIGTIAGLATSGFVGMTTAVGLAATGSAGSVIHFHRVRAARIDSKAKEATEAQWPEIVQREKQAYIAAQREAEASFVAASKGHALRRAAYERDWNAREVRRITRATSVLRGESKAIEEMIAATLEILDWPVDARCEVECHGSESVTLRLEVPLVEEIVPETVQRVLKTKPEIKESQRPDRQQRYSEFVCGLGLHAARIASLAAPVLTSIRVVAFRQSGPQQEVLYEAEIAANRLQSFSWREERALWEFQKSKATRIRVGGEFTLAALRTEAG